MKRAGVAAVAVVLLAVTGLAQQPLPDLESLSKIVRANLARDERETFRYAFKERRTDVHANPFGKIGTGGTRVLDVYPSPVPRLTYRRVIERDGVPVGAAELADQDRQYRVRVADVQKAAAQETPDARRTREQDVERARQRGQQRIDDVIAALRFKMDGRAAYNGVPAIVISFTPNPDANPSTREGKAAQIFAGKVWIDEAASEVMQVEATSIDDFSFGLGLIARVNEGTTATVTRKPIGDGLWMPTRLTLKGRGRAAVFRRFALDVVNEWSDYRRLPGYSPTPFLDIQR